MIHKCEYCDNTAKPCNTPCSLKHDKSHVCCTCDKDPSSCELPHRIVCDASLCNLKYQVDWYKIKLEESQNDISKLKALNNQFRIANIGSQAAQRLVEDGTLEISGIKIFVSRQRVTWEDIPIETGYILMCLHEEFSKQWASFLNEKAVKVQIRKELIAKTEANLAKNEKIRKGELNPDGSKPVPKVAKATLNAYEKIVLHNMKTLKMSQTDAENFAKAMGMSGEARDLKSLGVVN